MIRLSSGWTKFTLVPRTEENSPVLVVKRPFRKAFFINLDDVWLINLDVWPTSTLALRVLGGGRTYSWKISDRVPPADLVNFVDALRAAAMV